MDFSDDDRCEAAHISDTERSVRPIMGAGASTDKAKAAAGATLPPQVESALGSLSDAELIDIL